MPGVIVFVLVIVAVHAVGTALGGLVLLQENYSKREHGQDLLMPMDAAWFAALFCWALAALQAVCVVLARKRRPWVGVVLAISLIFAALGTVVGFLGSLAAEAPSLTLLVVFAVDVVAVCLVLGETSGRWFSVRRTASTAHQR